MSHAISQALLPEFDHEMATTRRVLERVPEDRPDFRPHPKSFTLARLAGHVSEIPWWAEVTLAGTEFDVNPVDGPAQTAVTMTSRAQMLADFDARVQKARALLAATTDAAMMETWSLKAAGNTVLAMPRVAVMRSFVMNHLIHHRAQLAVYLRMNDVPVPSIYGPSADEGQMGA
ncbi:MAG: DinB family protein [Vicinamibacterales bacterium]